MPKLFALTLAVASILVAPPAVAQSFFLQDGVLHSEGERVGAASQAAVRIVSADHERVSIAYEGRRIRFEAEVRLGETHLQVGVSRDARLTETTFTTRMLRGTWGPVMEMSDTHVRIGLPLGAPDAEATLVRDVALANAGRPHGGPWDHDARVPADDAAFHCVDFALAPSATGTATFRPANEVARHRIRTEGAMDVFEVNMDGFVFTGFRPHGAPCVIEEVGLGGMGMGVGSGDGAGTHRVVTLNPHTELFASPTSTRAFAMLNTRAVGIEVEVGEPSRFVVEVHEGRASILLSVFLHIPNSELRDAPSGQRGFGISRVGMPDWPERHASSEGANE